MKEQINRIRNYVPSIERHRKVYAVLIPMIEIDHHWFLLYQIRSHMISHPGQTSFPGGQVEKGESPSIAAIRETVEELGIGEEKIEIVAQLDPLIDQERIIYAFVAIIHLHSLKQLQLNEHEVERVFLLEIEQLLKQSPQFQPVTYKPVVKATFPLDAIGLTHFDQLRKIHHHIPIYFFDESLWGITAHFTYELICLLK